MSARTEKQAESLKRRWEDPDFREHMLARQAAGRRPKPPRPPKKKVIAPGFLAWQEKVQAYWTPERRAARSAAYRARAQAQKENEGHG